jgi:hypothetical protein
MGRRHAVCNLPTKFISNGVAFDGRGEGWDKRSGRESLFSLFPNNGARPALTTETIN